jgi:hypothetical protein
MFTKGKKKVPKRKFATRARGAAAMAKNRDTDAREFQLASERKAFSQNWAPNGKPITQNERILKKEKRFKTSLAAKQETQGEGEETLRPWSAKARRLNRRKKGGWAAEDEGSLDGWIPENGGIAGEWAGKDAVFLGLICRGFHGCCSF